VPSTFSFVSPGKVVSQMLAAARTSVVRPEASTHWL
jgi:hypothetical protein